jgi:hypothetical protein
LNQIILWYKWVGLNVVFLILVSCATSPELIKERRETLNVKVIANNVGVIVEKGPQIGQVHLLITEVDGTSLMLIWEKNEVSEKALRSMLRDCQKQLKTNGSDSIFLREIMVSCAASANLPRGSDVPQLDVTRYAVYLSTAPKPVPSGSDIPLYKSGGPILGGVRIVDRTDSSSSQVHADVNQCVDRSLEDGLVDTFSSSRQSYSSDVFGTNYRSQSITGYLKRFDNCLGSLGYTIEKVDSRKD